MPRDIVVEHPLDEKEIKKLDRQRWNRNSVGELGQGFTLKPHGRAGRVVLLVVTAQEPKPPSRWRLL